MKILPIDNCDDCPHYRWIEVNYSLECGLTCEQIRYKEIGADKALIKLFNQCPLQEDPRSEIELFSAFLVEQGLAEEYVQWKKVMIDDEL